MGHFGLLSPHASIYRPGESGGREGEAAEIAQYSESDETVICDGGTEPDPRATIRVLMALAQGHDPDPADARRFSLPDRHRQSVPAGTYQNAWDSPSGDQGPDLDRLRALLREYDTELEEAAETAENQEAADAYAVMAALAKGRAPPRGAAQRVLERAKAERE